MKKEAIHLHKKLLLTTVVFLSFLLSVTAQTLTINGTVVGQDGDPIPGANVVIKGTTTGTITGPAGDYTIKAAANGVLIFSFIGFDQQEIPVNGKTKIDVKMKSSSIGLEEVVAVGYGTQKKMSITGAISSVGATEIMKTPTASVANALSGKIVGLSTVQQSGQPGFDNPNLFIRGVSNPLILVDGVERPFTQLDGNEIESVSILKDASATAVYGIRGANGVVIVTTKRGTAGKAVINVSSSAGVQIPTRLMDVADSYTWAKTYNGAQLSDAAGGTPPALMFSDEVLEKFRTNSDPLVYPNTDAPDLLMKKSAMQTQHNINMSGGNESMKYFFSLGYLNQNGFPKNFKGENNFGYKRYNYRANLDFDLTKSTKLGISIGGRTEIRGKDQSTVFQWTYGGSAPWAGTWVDGKHLITQKKYISIAPEYDAIAALGYDYSDVYTRKTSNIMNLDFQLSQDLDFITKGLKWRAKYSSNYTSVLGKTLSQSAPYYNAWYKYDVDPIAYAGDSTVVLRLNSKLGRITYDQSSGNDRDWYAETAFSYNREFGNHKVGGLLLYNESKKFYPKQYTDIPTGYVGIAARATYDYASKYLVEFNAGYNGSENFAEGKRFGFLPSVSAGWVVSEEDFMQDKFVSFLKLRMSYGKVGNDNQGDNRFLYNLTAYDPSSGSISFGVNNSTNQKTASEGKLGNPIVTWATTTKQDYGLDLTIFGDKLDFSVDYFYEKSKDILGTRNTYPILPAIVLPSVNLGVKDNRGVEFEGDWRDKIGSEFNYHIGGNFSFARAKNIYIDEVPPLYDYQKQTGANPNVTRGYVFDGFWTEEDVAHYQDFPDAAVIPIPGDARYKDLNGDMMINNLDQKIIGYGNNPEISYSFSLGFDYRNWDFSMMWQGAGHVTRNFTGGWFAIPFTDSGARGLLQYSVDHAWTPETAETATLPRVTLSHKENNYNKTSSLWVRDASYLRLKNIQIGYNIKTQALKNLGVSNLRVYTQGYDLLTFDKIKFMDPEGKASGDYPLIQIINFGVNATF